MRDKRSFSLVRNMFRFRFNKRQRMEDETLVACIYGSMEKTTSVNVVSSGKGQRISFQLLNMGIVVDYQTPVQSRNKNLPLPVVFRQNKNIYMWSL